MSFCIVYFSNFEINVPEMCFKDFDFFKISLAKFVTHIILAPTSFWTIKIPFLPDHTIY